MAALNPVLINVNTHCVPRVCVGLVSVREHSAARRAVGGASSAVRGSSARCDGGFKGGNKSPFNTKIPLPASHPLLPPAEHTTAAVSAAQPSQCKPMQLSVQTLSSCPIKLTAALPGAPRTTVTPSAATFLLVCTSYTVYNKVNQLHTALASVCDILHRNTAL